MCVKTWSTGAMHSAAVVQAAWDGMGAGGVQARTGKSERLSGLAALFPLVFLCRRCWPLVLTSPRSSACGGNGCTHTPIHPSIHSPTVRTPECWIPHDTYAKPRKTTGAPPSLNPRLRLPSPPPSALAAFPALEAAAAAATNPAAAADDAAPTPFPFPAKPTPPPPPIAAVPATAAAGAAPAAPAPHRFLRGRPDAAKGAVGVGAAPKFDAERMATLNRRETAEKRIGRKRLNACTQIRACFAFWKISRARHQCGAKARATHVSFQQEPKTPR